MVRDTAIQFNLRFYLLFIYLLYYLLSTTTSLSLRWKYTYAQVQLLGLIFYILITII